MVPKCAGGDGRRDEGIHELAALGVPDNSTVREQSSAACNAHGRDSCIAQRAARPSQHSRKQATRNDALNEGEEVKEVKEECGGVERVNGKTDAQIRVAGFLSLEVVTLASVSSHPISLVPPSEPQPICTHYFHGTSERLRRPRQRRQHPQVAVII